MAERPRDVLAILKGCVILRLNLRLKGYVPREYLYGLLCYNLAAGSFFRQSNFIADFIRLKIEFYSKKNKKKCF